MREKIQFKNGPNVDLGLPWWLSGNESAYNAIATGDVGSILGWGISPGKGQPNPLQILCLDNPAARRPETAVRKGWKSRNTAEATCRGTIWAKYTESLMS